MNLGNTCYANSVIQVLHKIPELEEGVKSVADVDSGRGTPGALASELKKTFDQMDHSLSAVKPISLVNVLLIECDKEQEIRRNETFGERERGLYQQQVAMKERDERQDAEEFYSYLLNALSIVLPTKHNGNQSNLMKDLFEIGYHCTYHCDESGETYTTDETANKLYCTIRGGANDDEKVNFMYQVVTKWMDERQGVKLGLVGEVEKHSDLLGRTAKWEKRMEISSLPKYLCVEVRISGVIKGQFMRFYWKELPDSEEGGIACKIMRAVEFPFRYDIRDSCTNELQTAMNVRLAEGDELQKVRNVLESEEYESCVSEYRDNQDIRDGILQSLLEDMNPVKGSSTMPVGFAGYYELIGVVSHMVDMRRENELQGSSVKGGHYVGWIKQKGKWYKCDDDKVSSVTKQRIRELKGGSEAHSAYLCLYKYIDSNAK